MTDSSPVRVRLGPVLAVALLGLSVMLLTLWALLPDREGIALIGPASSPDGYQVWAERTDGTPVRWNPCEPVDWVLNPAEAPPNAVELVRGATMRIGDETGLDFRYLGLTDEQPSSDRPTLDERRYGTVWAPVLVAWTSPSEDTPLQPTDQAVAVPVSVNGVFVTAQVVLNADRWLSPDFTERSVSWGGVLVHEFGHVVGLDHVDDTSQLMYHHPGRGPVTFGAGDLAGLAAVGVGDGTCLDAGRPRHVDVEVTGRR